MKIHIILGIVLTISSGETLETSWQPQPMVTEFGIYPSGEVLNERLIPSSNTGVLTTVTDALPLESTTKIPGKLGITFGYCYEIPTEEVSEVITRKVEHPPMEKPDGTISTGYSYDIELEAELGAISYCTNYQFEHPWEIAIGIWTFSIHQKGQKTLEQKFNVYQPNH